MGNQPGGEGPQVPEVPGEEKLSDCWPTSSIASSMYTALQQGDEKGGACCSVLRKDKTPVSVASGKPTSILKDMAECVSQLPHRVVGAPTGTLKRTVPVCVPWPVTPVSKRSPVLVVLCVR